MIGRVFGAAVAGLAVLALLASCGTIESGNVGVRTTMGKVDSDELGPGLFLRLPPLSTVREFSAKEIGLDHNELTPKARDNLSLRDLDLTVFYRASPDAVADLYIKYAAQHQQADGSAVHDPAFLQHEANLALQKFAEKGGTSTVVITAHMQTAPLINIGSAK